MTSIVLLAALEASPQELLGSQYAYFRIIRTYYSQDGESQGQDDFGHGVCIARTPTADIIATVAHVALPSRAELARDAPLATRYHLSFQHRTEGHGGRPDRWEQSAIIESSDLRGSLIADANLVKECAAQPALDQMPCLDVPVALSKDVVLLRVPKSDDPDRPRFLNVVGPLDSLSLVAETKHHWDEWLFGDFVGAQEQEVPQPCAVVQRPGVPNTSAPEHFRAKETCPPFSPGLSGSPLLIHVTHPADHYEVFGLAAESPHDSRSFSTQDLGVTLLGPFIEDHATQLGAWLRPGSPPECSAYDSLPRDQPLLANYILARERTDRPEAEFSQAVDCLRWVATWERTDYALEQARAKQAGVAREHTLFGSRPNQPKRGRE